MSPTYAIFRTPRWQIIFFAALLGFLLSKGAALIPGYGLDDYAAVLEDRPLWFYFSQGRFTQAGLQAAMSVLHLSVTAVQWPIVVTFIVGGAAALALGLTWLTQDRGSVWSQAAVAALMAAFPYLTEYFWFRESLVTQCASFILIGAFFLSLPRRLGEGARLRDCAFPVVLLVALAGAQQTAFLVAAFFVAGRLVLDAANSQDGIRGSIRGNWAILAIFGMAVAAYLVLYMISRKLGGPATDQRASLVLTSDIPVRLRQIGALIRSVLFESEPIRSAASKWLLNALLVASVVLVAVQRKRAAVLVLTLLLVMLAGSVLLVSISREWWPVPRAIYSIGFAFGIGLSVATALAGASRVMASLIAVAAFVASMESASILHDQGRLNRWDLAMASALAHDVLAASGGQRLPLVISTGPGYQPYSLAPHTAQGDLNLSALQVPWALQRLISESTGNEWQVTVQLSSSDCEGQARWPAPDGIIILGGQKALVCLAGR